MKINSCDHLVNMIMFRLISCLLKVVNCQFILVLCDKLLTKRHTEQIVMWSYDETLSLNYLKCVSKSYLQPQYWKNCLIIPTKIYTLLPHSYAMVTLFRMILPLCAKVAIRYLKWHDIR